MTVRMILDCDPGHDDALAIVVAARHGDVRGITTVAGNAPLERTTDNALVMRELLGIDVPVHSGAARPLLEEQHAAPAIHGASGLDGADLPAPQRPLDGDDAVGFIIESCRAEEGMWLVGVGPLTNLGLALRTAPDLADRLAGISVMGGGTFGNRSAAAEFNIWADPEAAQYVLSHPGIDVRLVGLDATRAATVEDTFTADLRDSGAPGRMLADLVTAFSSHAIPLHDVLALVSVIEPAVVQTRRLAVQVDVSHGAERGRTTAAEGGVDVEVAVSSDSEAFRQVLADRLLPFPPAPDGELPLDHHTREAVHRWG